MTLPWITAKGWFQCFGVVLILQKVFAVEFPNTVVNTPRVECQVDSVKLAIETSSGNPSHMFVKGRHHEPACITRNNNMLLIRHESCGLARERSLNPAGVYYKVCVVVQLHPQFITKVDKTFCASCFYMEAVKELTNELGVSVMSSTEVAVSFPMPVCTYTIRRGSPTGSEIRFATVGEPVFHVWSCPSESYGALVQNCYVDDGQGNRILIIDQNGCGVDRYIIQTPIYNEQLNIASQESHVFKFADKMITRFTCQIKICVKAGNGCQQITPPQNCPPSVPGGRLTTPGPPSSREPRTSSSTRGEPILPTAQQPTTLAVIAPTSVTLNQTFATSIPSLRPPYFNNNLARFRNHFRSIRNVKEEQGDSAHKEYKNITVHKVEHSETPYENDFIDVVNELFILEDVGSISNKRLYEDILNAMANGSFKLQLRPENSICVPAIGFSAMLLLFALFVVGGLLSMTCLVLKNRSKKNIH